MINLKIYIILFFGMLAVLNTAIMLGLNNEYQYGIRLPSYVDIGDIKTQYMMAKIMFFASAVICIFMQDLKIPTLALFIGTTIWPCGIVIYYLAAKTMDKSWRFGIPERKKDIKRLVLNDIFSYSRNPAILGVTLIAMGTAIMTCSVIFYILFFAFLFVQNEYIKTEEDYLLAEFKAEYITYCNNVPRYIKFGKR